VNQGLATLAFFGVGVNLVLFLTRVLGQNNADAANSVSKWTGTVYIFSLVGAFLSDSYWGRYKTCAVFQVIFVIVSISMLQLGFPWSVGRKGIPVQSEVWSVNLISAIFCMSLAGFGIAIAVILSVSGPT